MISRSNAYTSAVTFHANSHWCTYVIDILLAVKNNCKPLEPVAFWVFPTCDSARPFVHRPYINCLWARMCTSRTPKHSQTHQATLLCTSCITLSWHFEPLNPFLLCRGSDKHSNWQCSASSHKIGDHCPTKGGREGWRVTDKFILKWKSDLKEEAVTFQKCFLPHVEIFLSVAVFHLLFMFSYLNL